MPFRQRAEQSVHLPARLSAPAPAVDCVICYFGDGLRLVTACQRRKINRSAPRRSLLSGVGPHAVCCRTSTPVLLGPTPAHSGGPEALGRGRRLCKGIVFGANDPPSGIIPRQPVLGEARRLPRRDPHGSQPAYNCGGLFPVYPGGGGHRQRVVAAPVDVSARSRSVPVGNHPKLRDCRGVLGPPAEAGGLALFGNSFGVCVGSN